MNLHRKENVIEKLKIWYKETGFNCIN